MRAPSTCVKFSQGMLSQHELLSRRGIGWLGGDFSLVLKSFWFLCHVIVSLFQRLNANLRKNSLLCSTQWKLLSQNISFQILFSVHTHTHTHTHTSFISIILRSCLLFGRKAMTNLDSILKSRDSILLTKVHLVTAMVFPVITYGCESWTIKKAECQRIDAFELWCWRRLLKSPLDCKEIKPVNLEISPEYSLKGLMLKLKLQYFGHLMRRADLLEKTLMLGKIEGRGEGDDRGRDGWMASLTQWTWVWASSGSWWWTGRPGMLYAVHGVTESDTTEWLNWTDNEL